MQNKLKPVTKNNNKNHKNTKNRTIMATGDNVLTAISVARECSIIDSEIEVFLGDVKKDGAIERVFWKSTKNTSHRLNPGTLEPNR